MGSVGCPRVGKEVAKEVSLGIGTAPHAASTTLPEMILANSVGCPRVGSLVTGFALPAASTTLRRTQPVNNAVLPGLPISEARVSPSVVAVVAKEAASQVIGIAL